MKTRIIVGAVIENSKGEILIGRKPQNRGVYLDAWHIPGGGIEEGEKLEDALRREVKEETNLEIADIKPVHFSEDTTMKVKDGRSEEVHMIFLEFLCKATTDQFASQDDLVQLQWVAKSDVKNFQLTPPGQKLFTFLKWL